jgi:hypothetical protein
VLPADGMRAAVARGDFGTSRWQLSDEITSAAGVLERGRAMSLLGRFCRAEPSVFVSVMRGKAAATAVTGEAVLDS